MKKFLWGFMPYLVVSILFFVAIGGGDGLVPASGESWWFPWTWALDESRSMIVAGLNGFATIITMAFVGLGLLVASTPVVEAKVEERVEERKAAKLNNNSQLPPPKKDMDEVANGKVENGTFVKSNN